MWRETLVGGNRRAATSRRARGSADRSSRRKTEGQANCPPLLLHSSIPGESGVSRMGAGPPHADHPSKLTSSISVSASGRSFEISLSGVLSGVNSPQLCTISERST